MVRFAPERDYGPFIYQDQSGQVRGLSKDFLDRLAPQARFQVTSLPASDLAQIISATQRGEVDLISSLRPTTERAAYLAFSRPYVSVPAVLVTRAEGQSSQHLQEFSGKPVAVGRSYAVESYVRERFPQVRWVPVDNDPAGLKLLQSRGVEALVADVASVRFAQSQISTLKANDFQIHDSVGFDYSLSFAYPKQREDIGARLDYALQHLSEADRQKILQRWLSGRLETGDDMQVYWLERLALALGVLATAGLALAWSRSKNHA
jgi:ABC-type amino acid transport substrate-binding protein